MVAPLSPASNDMLELHSSSSDDCCKDGSCSLASEAFNTCSLCGCGLEASPVHVQEYQLTHVQELSAVPNDHVDATSRSVVDASMQNSGKCTHGYVQQHNVHIGSMDRSSSEATHKIAGSSSAARFIAEEGPSTGAMSICGLRSEMEDAITVAHFFLLVSCNQIGGGAGTCPTHVYGHGANIPLHFFGVYDGHGGSQVSNFCKHRLHIMLANEFQRYNGAAQNDSSTCMCISWKECWEKAMLSTFHKIDAEIGGFMLRGADEENGSMGESVSKPLAPETVGSTAIVAVVGPYQIIIANCGDSRAVLSRGGQATALSVDHKPNREDEMARIEAAGGRVICWNGYRVFGVLAMSRAIGDRYLKPYVISEPEVKCIPRTEDDDCLILASDGLWDVLTIEEVCEVARRCLTRPVAASDRSKLTGFTTGSNDKNAETAAALLTKMALAQGSRDNISVVVVDLKNRKKN